MEASICSGCGASLAAPAAPCLQCNGISSGNRANDMAAAFAQRPRASAPAKPGPAMRWPHAISMLAAAVLLSMALTRFHEPVAGLLAQLQIAAATALIPVLLGWFVLLFRRPRLAWAGFVIALGVMLWLQWQGKLLFELRERVFHQEDTMVVHPTNDGDDDPRAPSERSDAEIRRALALAYQDAMAENEARALEFKKRHDALQLEQLLNARTLTSRKGIAQAREKVKASYALTEEQVASMRQVGADLDTWVEQHVPSRDGWYTFWNQHRRSVQRREHNLQEILDLQWRLKTEINAVLKMMEANLGRVSLQDGKLMFPDERTWREFNTQVSYINELAQQEAALKAQADYDARQATFALEQLAAPAP